MNELAAWVDHNLTQSHSPEVVRAWVAEIEPKTSSSPECEGCGVCCYGYFVPVANWETQVPAEYICESSELLPMARNDSEKALLLPGIIYMKRNQDRSCIALQDGRCSIYESRPMACRTYEAGGDECRNKRAQLIQITK